MNLSDVEALENFLNTPSWRDLINSFWRNEPIQNICSLTVYPFDLTKVIPFGIDGTIHINNQDTEVHGIFARSALSLARITLCNKQIIPYFNNFLDYAPYTRIEVFIPFLGIIELSTSEFMGKVLRIDYVFDFNSGMASVYIMADEVIKITKMAQVGQQIPIGSSNQRTMFQSLMQGIGGLGISAAAPLAMPRRTFSAQMGHIGGMAIDDVKSTVNTISNMQMETTVRGDLTNAFLSYYAPNNVYIIYTRPTIQEPSTYKSLIGKPSLMSKKLNQCFGFTRINSIHLENFDSALTEELTEIENLLQQGIILEKEDSIKLTTPILTDLSTTDICKFSFPNDSRAYAYRVYVDGVEMGYPLNWSATLEGDVYTVTMNNNSFPDYKTYSITVQAYARQGTIYKDSEVSAPITFTKAASGYTVYISDSFVWADANPPEDVPTIHFVYSDGTSASVSCNSLAASYSNVKSFTVSGESIQDITYTEKGTSHTVGTGMTLTADITITRIEIYCLAGDTLITMADGTERRIDSLAVGDEVLSYNPVTMELEADRITYSDAGANKTYNYYDIWEFSDGRILKTVHRHRLYNVESQGMVNMDEWQLGEHALTRDGCAALVKHTHVSETVNHYTIFTGNQNYFANGLLAGNKYTPDMELCSLCG